MIIGIEAPLRSLDFRTATDANSVHVSHLITQGLLDLDEHFELRPSAAASFEVLEGREFRFQLRQDLRFHDGSPIRSEDVLASMQQAAQPGARPAASFADLESMRLEESTLVIRFRKARAGFLKGELPGLRVFPSNSESYFSERPNGSGPYRFVRRQGRDLHFQRFEGFSGPPPNFERLIVRALQDPTTRYLSLLAGDVDVLFNALSPSRVDLARNEARLRVWEGPGSSFQYLGLNLRHPPLSDLKVRQALLLGLDRKTLVEHKLKGSAQIATSPFPASNPYFHKGLSVSAYDPDAARELLRQSSWKPPRVLRLRSSTDRDVVSWLRVIQQQWQAIGVELKLESSEFGHFFADIQKGNFESFSLRWTAVVDPDVLFNIFHSSQFPPGRNRVFYSNPLVDQLLEKGRSEPSDALRLKTYYEVQEILAKELPYLPLWYASNVAVAQSTLENFRLMPTGAWTGALYARKNLRKRDSAP